MFRFVLPPLKQALLVRANLAIALSTHRAFSTSRSALPQGWAAFPRTQQQFPQLWDAWSHTKPLALQSVNISSLTSIPIIPVTPAALAPIPRTKLLVKRKSLLKRFPKTLSIILLSAATYGYINLLPIFTSDGFKRSSYFWSKAFPIYMHYQRVVVELDIRQFITDVLYDYDTGGTGFGMLGFSHQNLRQPKEVIQTKNSFNRTIDILENGSDLTLVNLSDELSCAIHEQQNKAIELDLNQNRLDRVFSHISTLAESLRDISEHTIQNEKYAHDKSRQFTALFKKSFLEVQNAFNQIVNDSLTPQQHEFINDLKKLVQLQISYVTRFCIGFIEPHLRPYMLPLDLEELKKYREITFDALHELYADDLFTIITNQGGYYVKIGQQGAVQVDMMPRAFIESLRKLQDHCPHVELSQLYPMIERELGGKVNDIFRYIDPIPLGAASVGQVHAAELKDGRKVVIKLQYPNVEDQFHMDMKTINDFCKLAQPEMLSSLKEIEQANLLQFDFRQEAVNLFFAHYDLAHSELGNEVYIPLPYGQYCSKNVLVMERLPGTKITNKLEDDVENMAKERGMTPSEFVKYYAQQPAPFSQDLAKYRFYGKISDAVVNTPRWVYNWTVGWFSEPYEYQTTTVPIDIRRVIDNLFHVHANQYFDQSLLNCDNHPGNVMYCDGSSRWTDNNMGFTLGLIDYGQVKITNLYFRALTAKTILAMKAGDVDKIAILSFFGNLRTQHNYKQYAYDYSTLGLDYDDEVSRKGMNIQAYFESLNKADPVLHQEPQFVMVSRSCMMMRGLANALKYPVRTSDLWAESATNFLKSHPVLDFIIDEAMEEFTDFYYQQEALAKQEAQEIGNPHEYFVKLDDGEHIHKWAEAIGLEYNNLVYNQLFCPLPTTIDNPKILLQKLDMYRKNRPMVYERVKNLSPTRFAQPQPHLIKDFAHRKPHFVQRLELQALTNNSTNSVTHI